MFDDERYIDSDLQMRSILADAQEDVPAHVWEGISAELDRIDSVKSRKPAVLWWRRSAIAVAAAAAVAVGVIMNYDREVQTLVPEATGTDMIAVAEPAETSADTQSPVYMAEVRMPAKKTLTEILPATEVSEAVETEEAPAPECTSTLNETEVMNESDLPADKSAKEVIAKETWADTFSEDEWEEDLEESKKIRTSIVLSGLTGTNSVQKNTNNGMLRFPSISTIHPKTGIKQTKEDSSYGLPLSFGAGVKIGFTPRWSLGVGLNYTLLTRKFYGYYTHVDKDGTIEVSPSSDIRNNQHYIGIPVNAYYNIVDRKNMHFYAYAGGTVEKCISDKYDVIGQNIIHTEKTKGVQLSANIGIGVEFLLGKHLGLYIDPSLRYYFPGGQPKSIRTVQPLMMGFEMGLRVNL